VSRKHLLLGIFVLTSLGVQSQSPAQNSAPAPASVQKTPSHTTQASSPNEGQRIFEQNCSRCHRTPDGFSPHISGSILLHMRVRASLSQHDEQELLRFFNP
jgi:cytochrome c5